MTPQILWDLMLFAHGVVCAAAAVGGIKAGLRS